MDVPCNYVVIDVFRLVRIDLLTTFTSQGGIDLFFYCLWLSGIVDLEMCSILSSKPIISDISICVVR